MRVLSLTPILRMKEQAREKLNSPRATKLATTGPHRKRRSVPPVPLTPHGDEERSGDEKEQSYSLYKGGKRPTRPHGHGRLCSDGLGKACRACCEPRRRGPSCGRPGCQRKIKGPDKALRGAQLRSQAPQRFSPNRGKSSLRLAASSFIREPRTQLLRTAACRGLGAPGGALAVCSLSPQNTTSGGRAGPGEAVRPVGTCTANLREDRGGGFYEKPQGKHTAEILEHPAGKVPTGRAFETA